MSARKNAKAAANSARNAATAVGAAGAAAINGNGPKKHFSMIRGFYLADAVTLCNSASGSTSIFASLKYVTTGNMWYLYAAILLLPAALLFDIFDGRVARWSKTSSPMGRELDSLSDIISFGVAPAVLGFAIGLQGLFDVIVLLYFVNCGVSRLARYNVTAESNAEGGKVRFFEGTPIPTTVSIALGILYLVNTQQYGEDSLPGGKLVLGGWTLHPFVLVYAISGTLQISRTIRIPKP
ncbi:CDP-diacylglycerol-serine o-phosphatidyltransferase [Fimicolochytrium jonesii]|uniref:CDP-diacylglycerol-serine o-phosphatidyltransferase n=1 Tax=Fimicolochytrium jonesii TaxID=1396493 RepID=UPI0022FED12E|nr:CDP-diacylglycerol-serine o-phosphatidyltransferase [Fimicolochytrium jonesii]KAI8822976.1 CDP-diacylglycerol-serine o-phosphatidyltransferase [Fimicolochytrium jonesii]